jgi:hypothetical protein
MHFFMEEQFKFCAGATCVQNCVKEIIPESCTAAEVMLQV